MLEGSSVLKSSRRLAIATAVAVAFFLSHASGPQIASAAETASAAPPPTRIIADAPGANGLALCLVADVERPLKGSTSSPPAPRPGNPNGAAGLFYPAIVSPCDSVTADTPAHWIATDTRELRVLVKGEPMCLSARLMTGFLPLVNPFLEAFKAAEPGSSFAYLADDLKPNGEVDTKRLDASPELVVSACDQPDALDFWVYDDPSGTISSSAGPGRHRQCLTIHQDRRAPDQNVPAGTPVAMANCPETPASASDGVATFDRATTPPLQRWNLETGKDYLPTYGPPDPKAYFSGEKGLPIAGPLGKCLTADYPAHSVVTSDCDGRNEQDWKFIGNALRLESRQACLAAGADGTASLVPCADARSQKWAYTVEDSAAGRGRMDADLFARFRPLDDPSRCLAVINDPFKDPVLQRNPVRVVDCLSVAPRQMSWFAPTRVYTIRVALVRYAHEPDQSPMAQKSDAEVAAIFANFIAGENTQYRGMGLRFVFDSDHDFRRIDDPAINDDKDEQAAADAIAKVAAGDFYRKITFALTDKAIARRENGAIYVEYDPARMIDTISGEKFDYEGWSRDPNRVLDKAGLPAVSDFIDVREIDGHLGYQLSRYFGLDRTFGPKRFADTPEDLPDDKLWIEAGAPSCGNLRSATVNGKTYTPDRANNESLWGCAIGRSVNSLSPMQLAKANWVLRSLLNRIPLVACAPIGPYNASAVACEDDDSFALCKETAAFLAKTGGAPMSCRREGAIGASIGSAMKYQAVKYILQLTPEGQAFVNALAGLGKTAKPVSDKTYEDVSKALAGGKNVPLARAVITRVSDIKALVTRDHSPVSEKGFSATAAPLTAAEIDELKKCATEIFTPGFIANAPAIVE